MIKKNYIEILILLILGILVTLVYAEILFNYLHEKSGVPTVQLFYFAILYIHPLSVPFLM